MADGREVTVSAEHVPRPGAWRWLRRGSRLAWVNGSAATTGGPLDRDQVAERLSRFFESYSKDVAAAYLFGSVARGAAGAGSDVDVAVLFTAAPPPTLEGLPLDLEADLATRMGASAVRFGA